MLASRGKCNGILCHCAIVNTETRATMKLFLDSLDLNKQQEILFSKEPMIQLAFLIKCTSVDPRANFDALRSIKFSNIDLQQKQELISQECIITVNSLTVFKYLLLPPDICNSNSTALELGSVCLIIEDCDGKLR